MAMGGGETGVGSLSSRSLPSPLCQRGCACEGGGPGTTGIVAGPPPRGFPSNVVVVAVVVVAVAAVVAAVMVAAAFGVVGAAVTGSG